MPLNEAKGMRGYNPLIPKENRKPITREQKQMMLEALYGRKREDMNYTLPNAQQEQERDADAMLAAIGMTPEQGEALRKYLGVLPKSNMRPVASFDINNPPPALPPPGGWKKIPCILHRVNAKTTGQPESKICRTAQDRDHWLANGWFAQPQTEIEVDPEPELSQQEQAEIYQLDRQARQKKSAVMVEDEPEEAPKRRGRPPGSTKHQDDDSAA